ncbi:MAG: PAS domain-containing protein [Luteolibacter sp.]
MLTLLGVDYYYLTSFLLLPAFSVVLLLVLSFFLNPPAMSRWVVICCIAVVLTRWLNQNMYHGSAINFPASLILRVLSTAAAGTMACFLSYMRQQARESTTSLKALFDQLHAPIILSDKNGWICFMNSTACDVLPTKECLGKPYFDHFFPIGEKGRSIRFYLDLVNDENSKPFSIPLVSKTHQGTTFPATLMRFKAGKTNYVLTLLETSKPA